MTGFPSRQDYESLIYTLPQRYPEIIFSSVRLYSTSRGTATVTGSVRFRSPTQKTPNWPALFLITGTNRQTSNAIASLLLASASRAPTYPL